MRLPIACMALFLLCAASARGQVAACTTRLLTLASSQNPTLGEYLEAYRALVRDAVEHGVVSSAGLAGLVENPLDLPPGGPSEAHVLRLALQAMAQSAPNQGVDREALRRGAATVAGELRKEWESQAPIQNRARRDARGLVAQVRFRSGGVYELSENAEFLPGGHELMLAFQERRNTTFYEVDSEAQEDIRGRAFHSYSYHVGRPGDWAQHVWLGPREIERVKAKGLVLVKEALVVESGSHARFDSSGTRLLVPMRDRLYIQDEDDGVAEKVLMTVVTDSVQEPAFAMGEPKTFLMSAFRFLSVLGPDRRLAAITPDLQQKVCTFTAREGAKQVVAAGRKELMVFDEGLQTFQTVALPVAQGDEVCCMRFSPKGDFLAAGTQAGNVMIWDLPRYEFLGSWRAHGGEVTSLSFSDDGEYLVTVSQAERMTPIWYWRGKVEK